MLSDQQQVDATDYTATFTGAADTDIADASASVTAGSWHENNGNAGSGGSTGSFVVDTVTPTVTVTTSRHDVNVAHHGATISFAFSEAPVSFTLADTTMVGGTLSDLVRHSATLYTAAFTGSAGTDIADASVSVTASSWQENNGNAGSGGSTGSFTVDTIKPTVTVTTSRHDVNVAHNTATITFAFSEAPVSFTLADTKAVGGTLSNLQEINATEYTATFTGAAGTDTDNASVKVTAGSWQENNGNAGGSGTTGSFTVDTIKPTVTVTTNRTDVDVAHDTATISFAFSEAPASFTLADTAAVGGTLSNLQEVNATLYKATFTAAAATDIANASVKVVGGSWHDDNGNSGDSGFSGNFVVDTVTPTVAVATSNSAVNLADDTATITFTFSEAPVGFSLADTTAVGGTLSHLVRVDATDYTATFTGAAATDTDNASVKVANGSWQENHGNLGAGGSTGSFSVDTVTPTVTVATSSSDVTLAHDTAKITFKFSEAPTSFTLADTTAVGGTLSDLVKVNATHYKATFTGAANTDINDASVGVSAGSWQEGNGNPGAGGSTGSFTVDTVAPTAPSPHVHAANISLFTQAMAGSFTMPGAGQSGTILATPQSNSEALLAQPHHS